MLKAYTTRVANAWKPWWKVEDTIGGQAVLLRHFGDAIERFLRRQITQERPDPPPHLLLTKTPSVEGLDLFFELFPSAYLILLIRDGRAVVESGVRSFGWDYERAMQRWRNNAQAILDFQKMHRAETQRFILINYEDLVQHEERTLRTLFDFVELDPERFDFGAAQALQVTGSSDLIQQTGALHWNETQKTPAFNPLARFSNWDQSRHQRFNEIAGTQMTQLGYALQTTP